MIPPVDLVYILSVVVIEEVISEPSTDVLNEFLVGGFNPLEKY